MKRLRGILIVSSLVLRMQAQGTVTTGGCSVVNTGVVRDVKVTCGGLSEGDARQLVVLMNRILSDRFDLRAINSKLDAIGAEVGVINVASNPLAHVPPRLLKLYDDAELVFTSCESFHSEWTKLENASNASSNRQTPSSIMAFQANYADRVLSARNKYLQEYRGTLLPRLLALDTKIHRALGQPASPANSFETPQTIEISVVSRNLGDLVNLYESRLARNGGPSDLSMQRESDQLVKDCSAFSKAWADAEARAMVPPDDTQPSDVDISETKKYHTTLEPRLVDLKKEAKILIPDYQSSVDYADVKTSQDLQIACQNIHSIEEAYRRKVTIQILDNAYRTHPVKRNSEK